MPRQKMTREPRAVTLRLRFASRTTGHW